MKRKYLTKNVMKHGKKITTYILYPLFLISIGLLIYILWQTPSLERNWTVDQKILASVEIDNQKVSIKNIRDFEYKTTEDYIVNYIDGEYNLGELETLYYIIEPFGEFDGPAHTMMSFGFSDGRYLVVSAEIRKEIGESFSPIKGLFRQYEMSYVIGTERDLIKLRANHRKDEVFLYPINAKQTDIQSLFVSMLNRASQLSNEPEFYNTLRNNCTTAILNHVNEIKKENIPWSIEALMPSNSDKIIHELGLIDTKLSLNEAREYYKINSLSEQYANSPSYSQNIRKERK